jgi:MinD-like ATPase involved in chromosome partitioning or flagellar assembly
MGVIAFFSAKGSPGTTTTALLAAALWPAPVLLVDADTEGGDVALRLRRQDGAPVDRSRGLLSLLPLARREMHPATLPEHAQVLRGGLEAVAGLSAPGQAGAAGHLWANLADAFSRTTDRDVVLDCGRVTGTSVHLPLLQAADLVVCVLRPDVSGVVHARDRLAALQPHLVGPGGRAPRVGLVVVAERPRDGTPKGRRAS